VKLCVLGALGVKIFKGNFSNIWKVIKSETFRKQ